MSVEGFKEQDPSFATRAIHDAQDPEQWDAMPVVVPISLATTFKQDAPAEFRVPTSIYRPPSCIFIIFGEIPFRALSMAAVETQPGSL